MKKTQKYAGGGLSGIANSAQELMGKVDNVANSLKYGSDVSQGGESGALGFLNKDKVEPMVMKPNYFGGLMTNPPPLPPGVLPFGNASTKTSSFKKGGVVKSASKRADGIAQRGKTKGRIL